MRFTQATFWPVSQGCRKDLEDAWGPLITQIERLGQCGSEGSSRAPEKAGPILNQLVSHTWSGLGNAAMLYGLASYV